MKFGNLNIAENKKTFLFVVFVFVLAFLIYSPLLKIGFLSDDWGYVMLARDTGFLESFKFFGTPDALGSGLGNFRPLASIVTVLFWKPLLSFPYFIHAISIFLHAFIAILVGILAKKIFEKKSLFYIASLIFLCLPLNVEVIAWLCAGFNTLFAIIFFILFLLWYLASKKHGITFYFVATILFFASVLFKEFALLLPGFVFGIALLKKKKINWLLLSYLVFLNLIYFLWRFAIIGALGGYGNHLGLNMAGIVNYLKLPIAYLISFHQQVSFFWKIIYVMAVLGIVASACWLIVKKNKKVFILNFVILMAFIYLGNLLGWNIFNTANLHIAHHRVLYLSNVFWVILLSYFIIQIKHKKRFFLVASYVLISIVILRFQTHPWTVAGQTTQSILQRISEKHTDIPTDTMSVENLPDKACKYEIGLF